MSGSGSVGGWFWRLTYSLDHLPRTLALSRHGQLSFGPEQLGASRRWNRVLARSKAALAMFPSMVAKCSLEQARNGSRCDGRFAAEIRGLAETGRVAQGRATGRGARMHQMQSRRAACRVLEDGGRSTSRSDSEGSPTLKSPACYTFAEVALGSSQRGTSRVQSKPQAPTKASAQRVTRSAPTIWGYLRACLRSILQST